MAVNTIDKLQFISFIIISTKLNTNYDLKMCVKINSKSKQPNL